MKMEFEVQSLLQTNQQLENILEATKAHKRQEVSQLNKLHVETIKVLIFWGNCWNKSTSKSKITTGAARYTSSRYMLFRLYVIDELINS